MTNISPTGGIVPLTIPVPQPANDASKPRDAAPSAQIVPPVTKADLPKNNLPQNAVAEAALRARTARKDRNDTIADRVAETLSKSGLTVVQDDKDAKAPVADPQPAELRIAVPDAIPDKIPY